MKESRQNFMTMALVQRSRQVSDSIYRAMFYSLLSERDTGKQCVPSLKTMISRALIVLRFTEIQCKCSYYHQYPPVCKRAGTQIPIDY